MFSGQSARRRMVLLPRGATTFETRRVIRWQDDDVPACERFRGAKVLEVRRVIRQERTSTVTKPYIPWRNVFQN